MFFLSGVCFPHKHRNCGMNQSANKSVKWKPCAGVIIDSVAQMHSSVSSSMVYGDIL